MALIPRNTLSTSGRRENLLFQFCQYNEHEDDGRRNNQGNINGVGVHDFRLAGYDDHSYRQSPEHIVPYLQIL